MRIADARIASRRFVLSCCCSALLVPSVAPPTPVWADGLPFAEPPTWVTTNNGAALQKMSDANTKLTDKGAKRVFDQGMELAARGADEETQRQDDGILAKAEDRFTLLIEDLAPQFAYGYTNRANVRVARGNYAGAIDDYGVALQLAPLAKDAWVIHLNRGSTLLALGSRAGEDAARRASEALVDLQRAVELSKADPLALLGRGSALHTLKRYGEAAADYGAVLEQKPANPQPFWLRYALELGEVGRRVEALGIARRLVAKFDIEPESNLGVCSLLWKDGSAADRDEALRRWAFLPVATKERMAAIDYAQREWPADLRASAEEFLASVSSPAPAAAPAPSEPQPPPAAAAPAAAASSAPGGSGAAAL